MELTVNDLKPGDRVIMDRGIGVVQKGEKGIVTGKTEWQVWVKFKSKELKLGDNGTRYLKRAGHLIRMADLGQALKDAEEDRQKIMKFHRQGLHPNEIMNRMKAGNRNYNVTQVKKIIRDSIRVDKLERQMG